MEKIKDKTEIVNKVIIDEKYPKEIENELIKTCRYIDEILKYGYSIPNIIVYNYNKKELNMYKEGLKKGLKILKNDLNIIEYNIDFNCRKLSKLDNIVLIIDNIDFFCNTEKYQINKLVKLTEENKITYILLSNKEDCIPKEHYGFLERLIVGMDIRIKKDKKTVDDIYNELITEMNNRQIKIKVSADKVKYLISKLIDEVGTSECVTRLISDITKMSIIEESKEINEEKLMWLYEIDFDDIDSKKEEPKKEIKKEKSLKQMIGLKNVKEELKNLENYLSFMNKCKKKPEKIYLNLFFLGNPGTGKTTVARMFKNILFKLGYIKENKMVEIVPNDLIGEHVGETRGKTREILEEARNGLLFIDEAYLLYSKSYNKNGQNPFMEEALVELIKYMENPKNIIIFAGYPDQMREIYNANPGIKSRIFKEIEFNDYTDEELYKILLENLSEYDIKIDNKIKKDVLNHLSEKKKNKEFGNARYVEKLTQILINNHANRKLKNENFIIELDDIPKVSKEEKQVRKIGFIGD